jgi:hypothetical protein
MVVAGYESERSGLGKAAAHGFLLPPARSLSGKISSEMQGWKVPTEVRESYVKAAGNGRYAKGNLKKGDIVYEKKLIPMKTVTSLLDDANPSDGLITFASVADLERYISLAEVQGGYARAEILKLFEHFVYGFDTKVCCLNLCTYTFNHADENSEKNDPNTKLNIRVREIQKGGDLYYQGVAMMDIKVGEEFNIDYRRFTQPDFYVRFTDKHGYPDVRKLTLEAVYGSDAAEKCGVPTDKFELAHPNIQAKL